MSRLFKLPSLRDIQTANMTAPITRSKSKAHSPLLLLPVELLVLVFQSADCLDDAAYLAATNRKLQAVWKQHLASIYNEVAPASIPAYPALRDLLVDLGWIPKEPKAITIEYIGHVVGGSNIGNQLLESLGDDLGRHHDPQIPNELSDAEETRFIRAMYQILGLLTLKKYKQDKRVKKLDLKTQFLLSDFLCVLPGVLVDPDLDALINRGFDTPRELQREMRSRRNKVFEQLYGRRYHPIEYTPYEDEGRYAWWCDRQQETFKDMLTGRVFRDEDGNVDMAKVRDDMWYEDED